MRGGTVSFVQLVINYQSVGEVAAVGSERDIGVRVMVAEVGLAVIIWPATVLRGVGGHGLEFGEQGGIDGRGASVAVGAVGGKIIMGGSGGLVNIIIDL